MLFLNSIFIESDVLRDDGCVWCLWVFDKSASKAINAYIQRENVLSRQRWYYETAFVYHMVVHLTEAVWFMWIVFGKGYCQQIIKFHLRRVWWYAQRCWVFFLTSLPRNKFPSNTLWEIQIFLFCTSWTPESYFIKRRCLSVAFTFESHLQWAVVFKISFMIFRSPRFLLKLDLSYNLLGNMYFDWKNFVSVQKSLQRADLQLRNVIWSEKQRLCGVCKVCMTN